MSHQGYIHEEPSETDFVFGDQKLGDVPIVPDGQWDKWLPSDESQIENGFETYSCVSQATLKAIQILERQEYGATTDYAVRFLASISGTGAQNGNSPSVVAEFLRKKGCCYETDYPFTAPDFATFYQDPPSRIKILAIAEFSEYALGHSWVTNPTQQRMMDALAYSPLTAGVYAWEIDPQTGYYIRPSGAQSGHDTVIYGYERNNYWKVRDSYLPYDKKLAWDFPFDGVKRFTLHRQVVHTVMAESAWTRFLGFIRQILGLQGPSFGIARSPQWAAESRAFIKLNPFCIMGMHKPTLLNPLNTHHIRSFHEHPEDEHNPLNWAVLCRFHHFWNGHFGNWKSSNPDILDDAKIFTSKVKHYT